MVKISNSTSFRGIKACSSALVASILASSPWSQSFACVCCSNETVGALDRGDTRGEEVGDSPPRLANA